MTTAKKGFRQSAATSKKEQVKNIDVNVRNLQMAMRIMQMSVQQLATSYQNISNDMSKLMSVVNNLQYRTQALQSFSSASESDITAKADALKLKDYNEASDKEDLEKQLTVVDTVAADSICIITSTCNDENKDKGIFRSKFNLDTCGVPELQQKLLGCTAGAKVDVTLNGTLHNVELLGVRQAPPKTAEPTAPTELVANAGATEDQASATAH